MSPYRCELLARHHDRQAFRCGVPELDDYLAQRAGQDMRRHVSAVFVLVPEREPHRVAGYYTLSSASVVLADLPDEFARQGGLSFQLLRKEAASGTGFRLQQ